MWRAFFLVGLLVGSPFCAAGDLLENLKWLKEHGSEAVQAAQSCADVLNQMRSLKERCPMSNHIESISSLIAFTALEHAGESQSWLRDLAGSAPGVAMKEKAQKAIEQTTRASMDEICNGNCQIWGEKQFWMSFSGCYAHSLCAAGAAGPFQSQGLARCVGFAQSAVLRETNLAGETFCLKEPGQDVYCQEQHTELMLQSPSCYADTNSVHLISSEEDRYCSSSAACVGRFLKASRERPFCMRKLMETCKARGQTILEMLSEMPNYFRDAGPPSNVTTFKDDCVYGPTSPLLSSHVAV